MAASNERDAPRDDRRISRRRALASMLAAPLLARCGSEPATDDRVLIIGGGLSGLLIQHRLRQRGVQATVLEASARLGGRIYTLRPGTAENGISRDLYGEAGAERVPRGHRRLRALIDELGLQVAPYQRWPAPLELTWRGRRHRFKSAKELPAEVLHGLSEAERRAAPFELISRYVEGAAPPAPADPRSAREWLRELGMTDAGEAMLRTFSVYDLDRIGAAAMHGIASRDMALGGTDRLVGGTETLVRALRAGADPDVRLRCAAQRVEQTEGEVRIVDQHGSLHRAAHAVICLPLEPMRRLAGASNAAPVVGRRLAGLFAVQETKIHFTTAAGPLQRGEQPAWRFRDRFPHAIWPLGADDQHAVMNAFAVGPQIPRIQGAQRQGAAALHALLQEAMPDLDLRGQSVFCHDFCSDPHVGGVAAYGVPGTAAGTGALRDGRILYASADLSEHSGWMEGALQAAEEALAALPVRG